MTISRRNFIAAGGLSAVSLASGGFFGLERLAGETVANRQTDFEALRASIKGRLILPSDTAYERARRVWSFNPHTDLRPAAVVRCANANDVARSIAFARAKSLELAVRGGGHDLLGASVCDAGLVIDLSGMKRIQLDPSRRTALVEPGVISGEFKAAAASAGLAPVLGCNPSVGVAGLTLGGGIGWFLGTHGAACDNLLSATMVTAAGETLRASADANQDLYWAIRGGGGNFGVATELEFQLHPVTEVVAGVVSFRQKDIGPFLRFYRDYMRHAADPLAVEFSIFADPAPTIWAMVCWGGDPRTGLAALAPLRSFATPIADTIDTVPWSASFARMPERAMPSGRNTYWRGGTLPAISDGAIDQFRASLESAPPGWQLGLGHFMHGRICRVGNDETAMPRSAGSSTYFVSATWAEAGEAEASMQWVDRSWSALHQFGSGTYVNYLSEATDAAVRSSYGEKYQRLAAIKRKYDPQNIFHRNRNVKPTG